MEAAIQKLLSQNLDIDPSGRFPFAVMAHCNETNPVTRRVQIFKPLYAEAPDFVEAPSDSSSGQSESDAEDSQAEASSGTDAEPASEDESDVDVEVDDEADELDAELEREYSPDNEMNRRDAESKAMEGANTIGFLEGGKTAPFARAFARALQSSEAQNSAGHGGLILSGSKSVASKRQRVEAEAKADREAKKLRIEMKQRGHVLPARKGENPEADAREKALQKTATRGVVQLFNAVAKAQRRLREAEDLTRSRTKAAKFGKASFLADIRNARGSNAPAHLPGDEKHSASGEALKEGDDSDDDGPGWEVLRKGFTGLQGKSKMKDWDKQLDNDDHDDNHQVEGDQLDDDSM